MMTTQNETTSKAPTHTIYVVKPKDGTDKPEWIKVGVAWEHGDKDGLNLSLKSLGHDIGLTIRKNKPKAE